MPLLHAIVLGITQGLAEFLPISSSGHLQLVPWLFGWDDFAGNPGLETSFDVALHLGTLAGAVAYFRSDLVNLARAGFGALRPARRRAGVGATSVRGQGEGAVVETGVALAPDATGPATGDGRLAWLLVLSVVPAGITGVLFEDTLAANGDREWLIGLLLVVFGLVLLVADRLGGTRAADRFSLRDALVMGVAQALALQPGVSRSGVTITAARGLGFQRDAAARLSFLMSLPVIAGAGLYKGLDLVAAGGVPAGFLAAFVTGMLVAAVTGFAAVWATLRIVRTHTFTPFVVYRCLVGTGVILLVLSGVR